MAVVVLLDLVGRRLGHLGRELLDVVARQRVLARRLERLQHARIAIELVLLGLLHRQALFDQPLQHLRGLGRRRAGMRRGDLLDREIELVLRDLLAVDRGDRRRRVLGLLAARRQQHRDAGERQRQLESRANVHFWAGVVLRRRRRGAAGGGSGGSAAPGRAWRRRRRRARRAAKRPRYSTLAPSRMVFCRFMMTSRRPWLARNCSMAGRASASVLGADGAGHQRQRRDAGLRRHHDRLAVLHRGQLVEHRGRQLLGRRPAPAWW